jgi:hypothetical protein
MFPRGHKTAPAKPAPQARPRTRKDLWPPRASAAKGQLRELTQRRSLTSREDAAGSACREEFPACALDPANLHVGEGVGDGVQAEMECP